MHVVDRDGMLYAVHEHLPARPGERPFVDFAHSYYVPEVPQASALCSYEVDYTAALEDGNVFGVQFHPEKSGPAGLEMVRRFVGMKA